MKCRFWFSVFLAMAIFMAGCDEQEKETPKKEKVLEKPEIKKTVEEKPKNKEVKKMSKKVKLETSLGDIVIELNEEKAPVTAKNFLRYVEEGFYDRTIFHRVIANFMIQGGGFTKDMIQKKTHSPIVNEANNGLKNDKGAIAMARTSNPNSATSQFYINHKNNDFLNYAGTRQPGYAVFGKVTEGIDVIDKIAAVKTGVKSTMMGPMQDVPVETVMIKSAKVVEEK